MGVNCKPIGRMKSDFQRIDRENELREKEERKSEKKNKKENRR